MATPKHFPDEDQPPLEGEPLRIPSKLTLELEDKGILPDVPRTKPETDAAVKQGTISEPPRNKRGRATSAAAVAIRARQRQALEMAIAGVSYAQIAEQLHWKDAASVQKVLRKLMVDAVPINPTDVELLRAKEQLVLERLRQAHYTNALRGDNRASEIVLKTSAQIRALHGLDAPEKIDVQISDALDAEIESLIAMLPPAQ